MITKFSYKLPTGVSGVNGKWSANNADKVEITCDQQGKRVSYNPGTKAFMVYGGRDTITAPIEFNVFYKEPAFKVTGVIMTSPDAKQVKKSMTRVGKVNL